MEILDKVSLPLIAILRGIKPDEVLDHAIVLYEEGFRMIEVPTNSGAWEKSVALLQGYFEGKALIGAGTVISEDQYETLQQTGAKLLVTPNFNQKIAHQGIRDGMVTCIGALTPTEIIAAAQLGVDIVKVFPAGKMGLEYCKGILTVVPEGNKYYCVGGINSDNLGDYLKIGFSGAGLGSDLYRQGQSEAETRINATRYTQAFKKYKDEN